jgi:MFS family permease
MYAVVGFAGAGRVRVGRYCRGVPGDVGAAPIGVGSGGDLQIARMNAGLMTTTVMSAVVVFLAGALLAAHSSRPEAALILLSTSALGFIVATLLYANTYAWLLDPPDIVRFHSQIHRANVVSECFGVYCLLLAIPVTIVSVTGNGAVRWFVAVVTLVAIAGYQLSGASLLSHYLAQHSSKWRRAVISLIGAAFTALLVGLGLWLFVAAVNASDARLVPAFVIVGFLTLAGAYAIWAEPLQSQAGSRAAPSSPVATQARPFRAWPAATLTGPAAQPGLPTNAPPWAVAQAARHERREPAGRPLLSWLLPLLTLLAVIATLVLVVVTLRDQHNANARTLASVKQGQSAALSSIAALEGQTLQTQRAQRADAVTTGELTAKVFVTRIRQALTGLLAVLRTKRELRPAIPISDLHVSVPSGVSLLRTNVNDSVLADLSNFFGQMHITYGNFDLGRKHRKLSRRDHMRVCRTIKFGNKALLAFRGVPRAGVSRDAQAQVPKECR